MKPRFEETTIGVICDLCENLDFIETTEDPYNCFCSECQQDTPHTPQETTINNDVRAAARINSPLTNGAGKQ